MPYFFLGQFGLFYIVGGLFWLWMLYDCVQSGRNGQQWIWLLIFLNVIGAGIYFVTQYLPAHPNFFKRFGVVSQRDRDRLWQAEADAKNIGKPSQFITLGNLLFDRKKTQEAYNAYEQALAQEPKNAKALWGAAQATRELNQLEQSKDHLKQLLAVNPEYAYGDASLVYGEVLFQLGEKDAALSHLQQHVKTWSNPEAYLMLAELQIQQDEIAQARDTLETVIIKIKGFVPFQYRQNKHFVRQAERRLKALPKG